MAVIARPVDRLRAHPQAQCPKIGADRLRRPALREALTDRARQHGNLGPLRPGAGRGLRFVGPIRLRAADAGQLPLHRRAVPAQTPRDARRAEPRLGHRLDPSALVETQSPCHTENLHR